MGFKFGNFYNRLLILIEFKFVEILKFRKF